MKSTMNISLNEYSMISNYEGFIEGGRNEEEESDKEYNSIDSDLEDIEDELDVLLDFQAEDDAINIKIISGANAEFETFNPITNVSLGDAEDIDWNPNTDPIHISGEGFSSEPSSGTTNSSDYEFLPTSEWRIAQYSNFITSTRLSIDASACSDWVDNIYEKGWYTRVDVEWIVSYCKGNGLFDELCLNIHRNLEAAGLNCLENTDTDLSEHFNSYTEVSKYELTEAIIGSLSRETLLPGINKYVINISLESQQKKSLCNSKINIWLQIMETKDIVTNICDDLNAVISELKPLSHGSQQAFLAKISGQTDPVKFIEGAKKLKRWASAGQKMDGKERKNGLDAFIAINLNKKYIEEKMFPPNGSNEFIFGNMVHIIRIQKQIAEFQNQIDDLVTYYLPFVRRFAARNTQDNEDCEEVFQVSYLGLRKALDRFDTTRNVRLIHYFTIWMWQSLGRWRANENSLIRIPVHRHEMLKQMDLALSSGYSNAEVAKKINCSKHQVHSMRMIPRETYFPECIYEWDEILMNSIDEPKSLEDNDYMQNELKNNVAIILATLTPKEAKIIRMRFGVDIGTGATLDEVGKQFSLTRERVRQIEKKALEKLRRQLIKNDMQLI
jgi:RNA polymerase primary sigma factor